jgi:protein-S-isoprenylcysteine O-methyltransferase Ste14
MLVRHLLAIVLLPGTATIIVPALLARDPEPTTLGVVLGAPLILAGAALWAWTARLLARVGRGTLAPWDPTSRLVGRGPYAHVRNPMITGVAAVLFGEAALLGSLGVLIWALVFVAVNAIYLPLVEERGLARRFGEPYEAYRRRVPRWLPRLRS